MNKSNIIKFINNSYQLMYETEIKKNGNLYAMEGYDEFAIPNTLAYFFNQAIEIIVKKRTDLIISELKLHELRSQLNYIEDEAERAEIEAEIKILEESLKEDRNSLLGEANQIF